MITPSGYIYSKENITRWLKEGNETDPGNRKPLSEKDLKPFEQLKPLLEKFSLRRINYNQRREELLEKAMDTVRAAKRAVRPILEDPPLFTCPISKQRIQEPILTPEGKIYDKESLINNGYKDENGQQLDKNNCRYFEEFQSYLNTYNFYLDLNFSKRTTPVF